MGYFGLRSALLPAALLLAAAFSPLSAQKLSGPAASQVNRVPDASSQSATKQLPGHVPFWAKGATDTGPVADSENISLIVSVTRAPEVEASFQQLLSDLQNTASPRYHQWLTPQQIGDQYGPTQHDVDALTSWLAGQGITVDAVMPSRLFIEAHASAAVVGNAFHTSLHNYTVPMGTLHAPTAEPSLPASLAGIVSYIGGLASVPYHTHNHSADATTTAAVNAAAKAASAAANANGSVNPMPDYTTSSGYHALVPNDFTTIYDLAPAYASGTKGTGYPIAIIGGSQLTSADVANYETLSGLPTYSPTTIVPPATSTYAFADPGVSISDQTEGMLDFERAYGTAPGATIDFIISKNWLNGTITQGLLLYAINTKNDPILSLSFGACEALQSTAYLGQEATMFSQAAAQGISVFVSSGDAGVEGCSGLTTANTLYASISDYCSSANVTCVGGTEFNDTPAASYWNATNSTGGSSAISYIPEGGWNDPLYTTGVYRAASSGGGVSTYTAKPSFQTGTGVPADGQRDVPDISFSGSVHNAYVVCQSGYSTSSNYGCVPGNVGFLLIGGTSASAPSMAGVAALIDQKLGGRQGNMNPLLYKTFNSKPAVFHDATPTSSGAATNGVCTTSTPTMCNNSVPSTTTALTPVVTGYPLTVGYDLVTGLGSLDVNAFLTAVGLPAPTIAITASPTAPTINTPVTLTATLTAPSGATGTPTGTVQFYSNGVAIGSAVTLASGKAISAPVTLSPAGTFAITATYSGDSSFSSTTSAAFSLVVTNPTAIASSTTLTVFPGTAVTTTTTTTFTAKVTGAGATPTGTVTFFDNLIQKAVVTLVAGQAVYAPGLLTAGSHPITCTYSGDAVYAASACNAISVTATAIPTVTTVAASVASANAGAPITLTFTVTGANGTPTGSVAAFIVGNTTSIGSVTLNSTGVASGTLTLGTPGTYQIYGVYSSDATYATSTSSNVSLAIAGFSATITPATLSITDGAATGNTLSIGFNSVLSYAGSITSTCSMALNSGVATNAPQCSVVGSTPGTSLVNLAAGGSTTATVTIASSLASNSIPARPGSNEAEAIGGGIAFAGLLLIFGSDRRRALRKWRGLSILLFLSAALLTVSGCGSGSGSGSTSNGATTRGTYTVTVTSSSGLQQTTATAMVTIN